MKKYLLYSLILSTILWFFGSNAARADFQKVLFVGDSITKHAPNANLGWSGDWGMAASSQNKDYVHLLYAKLSAAQSPAPELDIDGSGGGTIAQKLTVLSSLTAIQADLVIVQLGENDLSLSPADFTQQYTTLVTALKNANLITQVYCLSAWRSGGTQLDEMIKSVSNNVGCTFVDISAVYADPSTWAASENIWTDSGVNWHPGDKGMQGYADVLWSAISAQTSTCGNGTCDSGETCSSCSGDCGTCTIPTLPGWTYCASENQTCGFSSTKEVQYGANNQYYTQTLTNGTFCANSVFGDPIVGIPKYCYYRDITTKKGDLNNDGKVDITDLGILLSNWGSTAKPAADINQNGNVDVTDLGILLSNWG